MSQSSNSSFKRHLIAQGKRPGTVDQYTTIVDRFIREAGVPADEVTAAHAYDFLVNRGNASGVGSAWYNVMFHAVVAWLTMRGLPVVLQGLRPKRVPLQPPRWWTSVEVRSLLGAVEQRHFRMLFQVMLATGLRVFCDVLEGCRKLGKLLSHWSWPHRAKVLVRMSSRSRRAVRVSFARISERHRKGGLFRHRQGSSRRCPSLPDHAESRRFFRRSSD